MGELLKGLGNGLVEMLSNKYIAFVFIAAVLLASYYLQPVLWKYIFSALITYFAAGLVMRYSLARGLFKIKHIGGRTVSEGHAFMALVFVIIAATFFSNFLASYIAGVLLLDPQDKFIIVSLQTLTILGLLLLDMRSEF